MILSSDESEILDYLKSWKGSYVSLVEICRCAGGRRKYRESPTWAKQFLTRLVDANLVQANDRGHYRFVIEETGLPPSPKTAEPVETPAAAPAAQTSVIVGDDYFPADSGEVGLPVPTGPEPWVSPQIAAILKKSGGKVGGPIHN